MDVHYLVKQANQIGQFFEAYPDRNEGEEGVAQHIERFWEPRMRTGLVEHIRSTGGEGLRDIVLAAMKRLPAKG